MCKLPQSATYCADEVHILATGSDRKIHYFDALDGTKIRDFEVAEDGDVHCISYQPKDHLVCTGKPTQLLQVHFAKTASYCLLV